MTCLSNLNKKTFLPTWNVAFTFNRSHKDCWYDFADFVSSGVASAISQDGISADRNYLIMMFKKSLYTTEALTPIRIYTLFVQNEKTPSNPSSVTNGL